MRVRLRVAPIIPPVLSMNHPRRRLSSVRARLESENAAGNHQKETEVLTFEPSFLCRGRNLSLTAHAARWRPFAFLYDFGQLGHCVPLSFGISRMRFEINQRPGTSVIFEAQSVCLASRRTDRRSSSVLPQDCAWSRNPVIGRGRCRRLTPVQPQQIVVPSKHIDVQAQVLIESGKDYRFHLFSATLSSRTPFRARAVVVTIHC